MSYQQNSSEACLLDLGYTKSMQGNLPLSQEFVRTNSGIYVSSLSAVGGYILPASQIQEVIGVSKSEVMDAGDIHFKGCTVESLVEGNESKIKLIISGIAPCGSMIAAPDMNYDDTRSIAREGTRLALERMIGGDGAIELVVRP
ncbi:hypothetical protein KC952_00690 [Candidatus Saccharibacteria bacterium]|nr:hypothetical protein [Candidatus Saccharibacteria bacterium]